MEIKEIEGFTGYFISDIGVVYSNLGQGNRDKTKTINLYEIKPRLTPNGYAKVYMRENSTGKRLDKYVHRLVAEAFIPNPDNKKYVNHKNCNRADNTVENLEWVTAKENTDYTFQVGHVVRDKLGKFESNYNYIGC